MTHSVPDERARMLVFVIARAIAVYSGRQAPTLADRRLAAQFLCAPGAPLERFEVRQFEPNGDGGFGCPSDDRITHQRARL
jgi:hypothetical protein